VSAIDVLTPTQVHIREAAITLGLG